MSTILRFVLTVIYLSVMGTLSFAEEVPHQDLQMVEQQVLREVRWDWRPEGWTIVFKPGKPVYEAVTELHEKRITLYVRPNDTPKEVAAALVHELAHAFSHVYLTVELRAEWLKVRGLPSTTPWYPSASLESDFAFGEGDFAESVSWTFQKFSHNSTLGTTPNKKQQALIKKWIETLPNQASE